MELPGFYFDSARNRYFPVESREEAVVVVEQNLQCHPSADRLWLESIGFGNRHRESRAMSLFIASEPILLVDGAIKWIDSSLGTVFGMHYTPLVWRLNNSDVVSANLPASADRVFALPEGWKSSSFGTLTHGNEFCAGGIRTSGGLYHNLREGTAWDVAFSPSEMIASIGISGRGVLARWRPDDRSPIIETMATRRSDVFSTVFIDPSIVLNGSRDGIIRTIDTRMQFNTRDTSHASQIKLESSVVSVDVLLDNPWQFLTTSFGGSVQLWDRRYTNRSAMDFKGHINSFKLLSTTLGGARNYESIFACGMYCIETLKLIILSWFRQQNTAMGYIRGPTTV